MTIDQTTLDVALQAVADACRLARRLQPHMASRDTLVKADCSPVTVADYAVQALICHRFERAFGKFVLVGEEASKELQLGENAELLNSVRTALEQEWPSVTHNEVINAIDWGQGQPAASGFWTLDPIDGTKGFLRGGQYAIALAYVFNGEVEFGVMGCPNLSAADEHETVSAAGSGQIFYATAGGGAWARGGIEQPGSSPKRIAVSSSRSDRPIRFCEPVESTHSDHDTTQRLAAAVGAAEPVRLDSQCKYAIVARGQADAYVRVPVDAAYLEKIWDHAAGFIIASEAGAEVTDIKGKALDFSLGFELRRNKGILCATPQLHREILARLGP